MYMCRHLGDKKKQTGRDTKISLFCNCSFGFVKSHWDFFLSHCQKDGNLQKARKRSRKYDFQKGTV